jgi:hypothetical protein
MSSAESSLEPTVQHLRAIRAALLKLHKALLESEKVEYEHSHGTIQSRGEFFQLVIGDEWFNWLRPISQFIVQIDETLSAKEPVTLSAANGLVDQAKDLLHPAASGTIAEERYYQAIQRDPEIALMHAEWSKLLATDK